MSGEARTTGRRVAGPVADLVELDDGQLFLALEFHGVFADDPAVARVLRDQGDFLAEPPVAGVRGVGELRPGVLAIEGTADVITVRELLRVQVARDQAGGLRAGLELLTRGGLVLVDLASAGADYDVYAHGHVHPVVLLVDGEGRVEVVGPAIPPVDVLLALEDESFTPPALGTRYAPPERLERRDEDFLSDLFSLTLAAVELMVGVPVYEGGDADVLDQALQGDAAGLLDGLELPDDVLDLVSQTLQRDPDARPQDPYAFLDEVAELASHVRGPSLADLVLEAFEELPPAESGDVWREENGGEEDDGEEKEQIRREEEQLQSEEKQLQSEEEERERQEEERAASIERARLRGAHFAAEVDAVESTAAACASRVRRALDDRPEAAASAAVAEVAEAARRAVGSAERVRRLLRELRAAETPGVAAALVERMDAALAEAEVARDQAVEAEDRGHVAVHAEELAGLQDQGTALLAAARDATTGAADALHSLDRSIAALHSPGYAVRGARSAAAETLERVREALDEVTEIAARVAGAHQADVARGALDALHAARQRVDRRVRRMSEAVDAGEEAARSQREAWESALEAARTEAASARSAAQADAAALVDAVRSVSESLESAPVDIPSVRARLAELQPEVVAARAIARDATSSADHADAADHPDAAAELAEAATSQAGELARRRGLVRDTVAALLAEIRAAVADAETREQALHEARLRVSELRREVEAALDEARRHVEAAERSLSQWGAEAVSLAAVRAQPGVVEASLKESVGFWG